MGRVTAPVEPPTEPPTEPRTERSVVIVGHVCIDENTGTRSGTDPEVSGPHLLRREAGSPAFFMNRQLQQVCGVRVSVIAPHGPDFREVDDSLPLLNPATAGETLLYRNHIEGDIRRQECFHAGSADPVPLTPALTRSLEQADIVVVAPLLPSFTAGALEAALAPGRPDALKMLLVQGYLRAVSSTGAVTQRDFDEYADVLPRFDVAVLSDEDQRDALVAAARWSTEFPQTTIVVTQNRHGATSFRGGVARSITPQPLERSGVGSVIGTGDVFSAALALALGEGHGIHSAVMRANDAAGAFIDGARKAALAA